jgi:phosphomannomutase
MRVLVADMTCNSATRSRLLAACGIEEVALDLTDGVRMSDANDHVLHVRPSGNAPELRVYVEAPDRESAVQILIQGLDTLQQML